MLTYITRRTIYSIPVMLDRVVPRCSGSCAPRSTRAAGSARARTSPRSAGAATSSASNQPIITQWSAWLGDALHGDFGTSERTNDSVCSMMQPRDVATIQLIVLGHRSSRRSSSIAHRRLLGGPAVLGRRLHVHRPVVPRLAMPPFWFGLLAIEFLGRRPKTWFHLDQPLLYFVGLHSQRPVGLQPRLRPTSRVAGADADRADHRGVEPVPARVDARRDERRLHPHRAGQGRAAAQGRSCKHAFRNALIPLVTVMALDTACLVRWADHHRADLLDPGHGPAASSTR